MLPIRKGKKKDREQYKTSKSIKNETYLHRLEIRARINSTQNED